MDNNQRLSCIKAKNCNGFVQLLNQQLRKSNFRLLQEDLAQLFFSPQVDTAASLDFIIDCLLYCQQHRESTALALHHLLLQLIPSTAARAASPQTRAAAVQLFHAYCDPEYAKLAAKIAAMFNLIPGDLTNWQQVVAAVQQMLQNQTSYKAAVLLLMQFEGLDESIDKAEVITQLVADGQENLGQQWAQSLGKDYQVMFVEACVELNRLKAAARAVRQLGLATEFPNVDALYRQRSLSRLVNRRLWQVALSFVGNDMPLQTQLVQDMADAGELALAEEYRKQLRLPESLLAFDPGQVAAREAARREQYLQLDLPPAAVLFVDDAIGLCEAAQLLHGSGAVGLDVEWKPSHTAGVTSPAALLQVANRRVVVLFDLLRLALSAPVALDACLGPLLASPYITKLGFEVAGDLTKLANSWPFVRAFRDVQRVLDLKPLWVEYGLITRYQGASARILASVGLSTLCKAVLGKPLDKSQQMSDWTVRPLSSRQTEYAALDALVLPRLFDAMSLVLGPERQQQLLERHLMSFSRAVPSIAQTSPAVLEWDAALNAANSCTAAGGDRVGAAAATTIDAASVKQSDIATAALSSCHSQNGIGQIQCGNAGAGNNHNTTAGETDIAMPAEGTNNFHSSTEPGLPRVLTLLQQHGLQGAYHRLDGTSAQAPGKGGLSTAATAVALGVPRACVAKTMAVMVDSVPWLVLTRGDQRIDTHKLAALLGVRRKAVRMAPDDVVQATTGFAAGGIPPFGHHGALQVLVDARLQAAAAAHATPSNLDRSQSSGVNLAAAILLASLPAGGSVGPSSSISQGSIMSPVTTTVATTAAGGQPQLAPMDCMDSSSEDSSELQAAAAVPTVAAAAIVGNPANAARPAAADTDQLLYVQCGYDAIIALTFQQIVQLSNGQVADVADVPAPTLALASQYGSNSQLGGPAGAVTALDSAVVGSAARQDTPVEPHLTGGQQTAPRFLVDSMLGRLCRWLRVLGVDAQFVEAGERQSRTQAPGQQRNWQQHQQNELIQLVQDAAVQENRLFLTRDSKLVMRRDVGGSVYLLQTDDPSEQLVEISKHFGIRFDERTAMSRCSSCNAAAFQPITKEAAAGHVPQRVLDLVDEFWQCGKCYKVFWMGPKSYAAINLLEGLFTIGKTRPTPLQSTKADAERAMTGSGA